MESGYVRIYRTLTKKGYYTQSEYVHLWVHLIMKATYRDKEYLFNNEVRNLKAGQFISGRKILSKETGIQESKVERILKCFETEQQIEQQAFNKFRIISILNWNEYQQIEQQDEQQMNNKRTTSEQQVNTINKDNKDNKENNKGIFQIPTLQEIYGYCMERKNKINAQYFLDYQTARDWKLKGGQKIKDWKAVIRTWEKNDFNKSVPAATVIKDDFTWCKKCGARRLKSDVDENGICNGRCNDATAAI